MWCFSSIDITTRQIGENNKKKIFKLLIIRVCFKALDDIFLLFEITAFSPMYEHRISKRKKQTFKINNLEKHMVY